MANTDRLWLARVRATTGYFAMDVAVTTPITGSAREAKALAQDVVSELQRRYCKNNDQLRLVSVTEWAP